MIDIPGYSFAETIHQSTESTIYRGTRLADGLPVVCKILNREFPTERELSVFRREYQITARLEGDGAVRAYALVEADHALAMILEDSFGVSLDRDERLVRAGLGEKLSFAANAAEALSRIHARKIIHRNVSPANILYDPRTLAVRFIDFGLSLEFPGEITAGPVGGTIEGTLSFIAPEQTGRLNASIDFRSDLYSLGAVLYGFFCGKPPFAGKDDLELVYGHIARLPVPLREIDARIPETVSAIVDKLLRKDKRERYQSAAGLANDLSRCAREFNEKQSIGDFPLGESDGFELFTLPDRLYGRTEELSVLTAAYDDVRNGASRLLLVSGEPGIGKTALIREIHASIQTGKAFFIAGKFNQLERNIPYGAVVQAFQALAAELAMMGESFLEELRQRLGPGKDAILELVPALSTALGAPETPPSLDPASAQNRLQLAIRDFLAALAGENRPVVLVLDDLQWCDPSTLDLINFLMGRNSAPRVLIVGAYRDTDIDAGNPLSSLARANADVRSIRLRPFDRETLNLMIADALRQDPDSTLELSGELYGKTGGNPFYVNQALLSLRDRGAFILDRAKNRWDWDMARIREAELGANVVEFLISRIREIPDRAIAVLKIAACIGDAFDARMLSAVGGEDRCTLETGMRAAIERELIVPTSGDYRLLSLEGLDLAATGSLISFKFRHDRLRQALLSMVPEGDMRRIRARIGGELLKAWRNGAAEESIFEVANHLNAGIAANDPVERRRELSDLDKAAGDRAMKATAFRTAAGFYEAGLSQLSHDEWMADPRARFALLLADAEARFLAGDPESAITSLEEAGQSAATDFDAASISIIRSRILEFKGELYAAIGEIRRCLTRFDVRLPEDARDIQQAVGVGIGRLTANLARVTIEELPSLGEMKDGRKAMAMRLLAQAVPAAIQVDYPLYLVATLAMMDLTLTNGLTRESCKCVADAGILVASMLGDYETGYRLGKAAFALIDRLKAESQRPAVYFSFTYVSHMRTHYREGLEYYGLSWKKGLELGDMQHAMYAISHKLHLMMWVGADLPVCERETGDAIGFLAESHGFIQLKLAEIVMQAVKKFRTPLGDRAELDWEKADSEWLDQINGMKHMVLLVRFSQYNAFFHYLMGEGDAAARWNDMAEGVIFASGTDFPVADHYLTRALLAIDRLRARTAEDEGATLAVIETSLATLGKWAESCPENFGHKYLLVQAELSAWRGEPLETTLDLYRRASASIGQGDFQQMTALVNELQGRFWLDRGDVTIAKAFLQDAQYHYGRWGAVRKTQAMERRYPVPFTANAARENAVGSIRGSTDARTGVSNELLDIGSVTKSVQAISGEIKAEGLLKTLLGIVAENAGAQKGSILLDHGDGEGLRVEACITAQSGEVELAGSVPFRQSGNLCHEIADFVRRGKTCVALDNATSEGPYRDDPYIRHNCVKSLLCMPILHRNTLIGLLYLENNLAEGAFTGARLAVLEILAAQAAISMEIAWLYAGMEKKVAERTRELNEANERLQELTLIDPLTRLNNRRYFLNYIVNIADHHIQKLKRTLQLSEHRTQGGAESVIGVFLFDIDHFKAVNDEWGHAAGDTVLMAISTKLKSIIRADDFIVRWGGEEFLVILNNTRADFLETFARKALASLSSLSIPICDGVAITKTCSIGYARLPFVDTAPDALSLEQTIMLSDRAMYAAKLNGRNCAFFVSWNDDDPDTGRPTKFLATLSESPDSIGEYVSMREIRNA